MNSLGINTPRRSKRFVLGVVLVLTTVLSAARTSSAQQLRPGISVVMAASTNAAPMPEADDENAWIVTVVRHGAVFFGTDQVTAPSLEEAMKSRPRNREQKLYIKADALAPFANVERVLEAGRSAFFETSVLLTSQPESAAPGTIVPPKGLEVLVGPPPSGSEPAVVQVLNSGQQWPILKVNAEQVPWDTLQSTLRQLFQNRGERLVLVKADGLLPFSQVVHVVDACRATGAKVVLVPPGQ
jgi:biopolymer transport protein ExbD